MNFLENFRMFHDILETSFFGIYTARAYDTTTDKFDRMLYDFLETLANS